MSQYEKLGVFYLGTENKGLDGGDQADFMLLDSRDLVTHAMCVGMTGSGKTGLGICLLEEAAMDGIPAIVVDPKGDMGNLLLTFPDLAPSDFEPWIHPEEAEAQGMTQAEMAAQKASIWRQGLADSMQDGERIRALRQNAEFALYTPGGQFGRPLSLEGMFKRPEEAAMADPELLQEVISTTATSLLHLVGITDADPVSSREHVFLSTLIQQAWLGGHDVAIASLVNWINKPPFKTIGVMDVETYLPEKERFQLALRFNNLLASPAFAAFMEGEPLDIPSLLYTPEGKPKISILTLAHLGEAERMFVVALLLNRMIAWMRTEQGTSSLRALFYMDEVFGYFPPVANPPAKKPLLTLLK
ncbi:MAG: ATP-binding protein, partial [Clostridiaceae bacterium]|nr:ATP-binding protein [Clostridiaceae bacterium]